MKQDIVQCGSETLPKDTRALGRSSRCRVASFAIAVTTKQSSLDWDDRLNVSLWVDSCPRPRRLRQHIGINSTDDPLLRKPKMMVHFPSMKIRFL